MAEQTIIIHINGYWREQYKTDIKETPGVFFVYEANFNERDQTIDLLKMIYIGDAENIRAGIVGNENYASWKKYLAPGNELCYAYAPVDARYRDRVKTAYIITHKPPANTNADAPFLFDKTTLISTGRTALVNPVITVRKNTHIYPETFMVRQRTEMIPVRAVQVFNSHAAVRRYAMGE